MKVYPRQNQNNRAHAVHACISLWGACIRMQYHRPMHALTAWALLFWFHLGYTFISSYFVFDLLNLNINLACLYSYFLINLRGLHYKHFNGCNQYVTSTLVLYFIVRLSGQLFLRLKGRQLHLPANIWLRWMWLKLTMPVAYCTVVLVTAVKSFMTDAQEEF